MHFRRLALCVTLLAALSAVAYVPAAAAASLGSQSRASHTANPAVAANVTFPSADTLTTASPIKHLVVIFQENVSFDHYFGTYPHALNLKGEKQFTSSANTPSVSGLNGNLLHHNQNLYNPVRLSATQALTCDQNHEYTAEQQAQNGGLMDKFVQYTTGTAYAPLQYCSKGIVMDYYDGNTVTAMWNYAQHFAMSDNSYETTFGPSTPGAINLVSGDTGTVACGPSESNINSVPCTSTPPPTTPPAGFTPGTNYSDNDPYYDNCSNGKSTSKANAIALFGPNVGDYLDQAKVSWGWFQGGFGDCLSANPKSHAPEAFDRSIGVDPATDTNRTTDYSPHHEPFQYYFSTSNAAHLPPTATAMIGSTDQANHQYDLKNFWKAADNGYQPAVSFLKARRFEDGHAGYSDPLDEQAFITRTINHLEKLPTWKNTAVVIAYDDSDGWYDHQMGPIVNHSVSTIDVGCGSSSDGSPGRCGYGPRLPLVVISPYSKHNYVDHGITDQTSVLKFVEDNWLESQRISSQSFDNRAGSLTDMFNFHLPVGQESARKLFLNPRTGQVKTQR